MDAAFWHRCWQKGSLGFHQESVHPFLDEYLKPFIHSNQQRIFVPLCGKSLDMLWLAEHGQVIGNEFNAIACRDFFDDNGIKCQQTEVEGFICYSFDNLTLYQGDFFNLTGSIVGEVDMIYDRAAIIALPEAMQTKYAEHLSSFINQHTSLFLISLEFPKDQLTGPPFPVFESDIKRLFSDFHVECLANHTLVNKQFAQRTFDVDYLVERLYLIKAY